jgi:hypothetical protein
MMIVLGMFSSWSEALSIRDSPSPMFTAASAPAGEAATGGAVTAG